MRLTTFKEVEKREPEISIYERAVSIFGEMHQKRKCIEELGELITAICHYQDGRISLEDLASEVADVEIMMSQMRVIIGDELINIARRNKMERLRETLSKQRGLETREGYGHGRHRKKR